MFVWYAAAHLPTIGNYLNSDPVLTVSVRIIALTSCLGDVLAAQTSLLREYKSMLSAGTDWVRLGKSHTSLFSFGRPRNSFEALLWDLHESLWSLRSVEWCDRVFGRP